MRIMRIPVSEPIHVDHSRLMLHTVHRLVSCLGLFVHLSPHLAEIQPLLEVLQVKDTLTAKIHADGPIKKDNVKKLVKEFTDEIC